MGVQEMLILVMSFVLGTARSLYFADPLTSLELLNYYFLINLIIYYRGSARQRGTGCEDRCGQEL